jgi:hypothetical protein
MSLKVWVCSKCGRRTASPQEPKQCSRRCEIQSAIDLETILDSDLKSLTRECAQNLKGQPCWARVS